MDDQSMQERLSREVNELVSTVGRLADSLDASRHAPSSEPKLDFAQCDDPVGDMVMPPGPAEEGVTGAVAAPQEIFLGFEVDQCSGSLSVRNRNDLWVSVPRGLWTKIDVAIDGQGYWYWRCRSSSERSRGEPNYRQRVKRLRVLHSTEGRKITWACYDLL